ncbi:helix-turn-helix transcriptional regulator [Bifidobacterium crudilactis]|jgi:hypothetical protein|uniref:helix-turn-helix transcriptional regulator n=1 Tax=Bifidobacterium crudilactis TaxID=327277 RepID=UPI002F35F1D8
MNTRSIDDVIFTPQQIEDIYHISKNNLAQLRYSGKGPVYLKPTPRTILYRKSDVDTWLASSARQTAEQTSTSST